MVEFEEETFSKPTVIIMLILVGVIIWFILDVMTGGFLFKSILCMVAYFLPLEASGYLGCQAIPI